MRFVLSAALCLCLFTAPAAHAQGQTDEATSAPAPAIAPNAAPAPQAPAGTTPSGAPIGDVNSPEGVPLSSPKTDVAPSSSSGTIGKTTNPIDDDAQRIAIPRFMGVDIRLSGYFWADTGYMDRDNAQAGQYDQKVSYLQGRFVLGAGLSRSWGKYYAAAKVEFLGLVNEYARSQYEPHTLDAYVRVGHEKWWDVQVGRFLAWEIYHRGQGIEFWTAEEAGALGGPALYWLDLTRGYRNESGQAAFHLYPTSWLKFEVAAVYGQENNQNNYGIRPALHFTWKDLQFLAGYEVLALRPQTDADKVQSTTQGYAARLQYTFFKHVTVGGNFAQAFVKYVDIQGLLDSDRSGDRYTAGGFVDIDFWKNSIGLGYHYTNQLNRQLENNLHHQAFVSYLYRLPIQGLSVKAVYGFALAHIEDIDTRSTWENYVHSFRLRISYEFN